MAAATKAQTQSAYATAQALGGDVAKDQRDIAAVMWLASLIFLMIPGMLVLLNHNASPYLKQQAREGLELDIYLCLGQHRLHDFDLDFYWRPIAGFVGRGAFGVRLMGANAARSGNAFRVPMTWRPLQD